MSNCHALEDPNTPWSFCPSAAASILFMVLFAITTIIHLIQAIHYRSAYCWVIIMSAFWQAFTYIFRTLSIYNPASFDYYAAWFVVILVAPLWTNAFAYMVFGRMVYGAAQAATGNEKTRQEILDALHIYMGGVGIQLFFILLFAVFGIRLFRQLRRSNKDLDSGTHKRSVMMLFYAMFVALALIVLRIIFRLIEYSGGFDSKIPRHEAYQYALDSLPMLIALVAFNVVHPARVMAREETKMPKFWQRNKRNAALQLREVSRVTPSEGN